MTPLIAIAIAVVAGLNVSRVRLVPAAVIPPVAAVIAAQSTYLGAGRGSNPASETVGNGGYWTVQVIVVVIACGLAAVICSVRARVHRTGRSPKSLHRLVGTGRQRLAMTALGMVAAFGCTLGLMFAVDRPQRPGSGDGGFPVAGAVGLALGLVGLLVLVAVWRRLARADTRDDLVPERPVPDNFPDR